MWPVVAGGSEFGSGGGFRVCRFFDGGFLMVGGGLSL